MNRSSSDIRTNQFTPESYRFKMLSVYASFLLITHSTMRRSYLFIEYEALT